MCVNRISLSTSQIFLEQLWEWIWFLDFLWDSNSLENSIDFSKDLLIESFIFVILLLSYNRLRNYGKCSLVRQYHTGPGFWFGKCG